MTASWKLDSARSPSAAWPPADEDAEFPGYKGGGSVWLRLNMEGRGACDPNKFQILFPATSGSSCVQALRPFPTSPLSPLCEGLLPFTAWSPRATPAAGCERKECVSLCVRDTRGLFGGRGFCPHPPFIGSAAPVMPPPLPGPYGPQG